MSRGDIPLSLRDPFWSNHKACARFAAVISFEAIGDDVIRAASCLEASTSSPSIKIQLLLRKNWRNAAGIEKVLRILLSIGLQPTASGLATVSAEAPPEQFESVFGVKPEEKSPRPPSGGDFGQSGGFVSSALAVPAALEAYVESISAAPPHTYFQS
jgi:hypothetical protein